MKYNEAEYNALRAELLHHDRGCLTIFGFLLTASTAIYGLAAKEHFESLLIILSVIWFIGFLYLVEKRTAIRRISFYIKANFEGKDSLFQWETWSYEDRHSIQKNKDCNPRHSINLPRISPLMIEFSMLLITNIVNSTWLYLFQEKTDESVNQYISLLSIFLSMLFILFSLLILLQYYFTKVTPDRLN